MKCWKKLNKKVKRLDIWDIGLVKWSVLFFTLFLVALFPVLASWYWWAYLLIGLVLAFRPTVKFFRA